MGLEFARLSKQILSVCKEDHIENLSNFNHKIVIILLDIIIINKEKNLDQAILNYIL